MFRHSPQHPHHAGVILYITARMEGLPGMGTGHCLAVKRCAQIMVHFLSVSCMSVLSSELYSMYTVT